MTRRSIMTLTAAATLAITAAACGGSDGEAVDDTAGSSGTNATVPDAAGALTLVVYDSFPEEGTALNDALAEFTAETGTDVDVLVAGDTGTMLAKAALTAGNPEGDVMWGVDNTFLSRAIDDEVFEPYVSPRTEGMDEALTELVPKGEATPVDFGDVCVNYDIGWFTEQGIDPPETFDDLTDPAYRDLLVVQNPATSSPGMAFMLATIDEYGSDGWLDYWSALRDNGVEVLDSWSDAYYSSFTRARGGDRPLVVSYGSSPPAEVIFADPPRDDAPTAIVESTCFRQVEFAGVLRGTDQPAGARALIDFLVGPTFQEALPLTLFVFPSAPDVELPPEFDEFAVAPEDPRSLDPTEIEANRADWIDEWTATVLD